MAWSAAIPAIASAAGNVASSAIGAIGQSNLNQANRDFAASQAQIGRSWSATQANEARLFDDKERRLQDQWQTSTINSANAYNTMMSNTAMQRRVADLKAAGLNPLMAMGALGGAVAPQSGIGSGGAPSSPSPSGITANTPGTANPMADLNLGKSAADAALAYSTIKKQAADATASLAAAKKDNSQTYDPGQFSDMIRNQMAGVTASASQANQNVLNLQASVREIDAKIEQIGAQTRGQNISNEWLPYINSLNTALTKVQTQLAELQVPKAKAEATVAEGANSVLNQIGGVTDAAGSYIGNKAADLHDWVQEKKDQLSRWWDQAVKNSDSSNYR